MPPNRRQHGTRHCSGSTWRWIAALVVLAGCRAPRVTRDVEYGPLAAAPPFVAASPATIASAMMPVVADMGGPHSVDEYVGQALSQSPQVQAKRKLVEAAALRVPQAASLKDPSLAVMGYPITEHAQQLAGGRMTVDLTVSQQVPWLAKLAAQVEAAEAEVDMARAELVAVELEVVEQVKRAYYELAYAQRSLAIMEQSRKLAEELSRIAEARFRTAAAGEQDLLRAQLEVSGTEADLVRMRQELESAQARLARLLHISPDTPVRVLDQMPEEQVPQDLEQLYARAIAARPELHGQLAAIRRDRFATDLARLQYFPDMTFSFGWGEMTTNRALAPTADGIDNVSLGLMADLPVYRRRLAAAVREAESRVVAGARQYDGLRDETQEEVKDLFAQATSQQELLGLFASDILPKAEQTLRVSMSAYQFGTTDFLNVTESWQQLLKYQLAKERIGTQLRQTLASLERVVGGFSGSGDADAAPALALAPGAGILEAYHAHPCGCMSYGYCPPAPLGYTAYCGCPTPVATRYASIEPVPQSAGPAPEEPGRE